MGLQFIFGGSGAGKSTKVYDKVIRQSMQHPEKNYIIMVPDQFTMYTQKELCLAHPRGGIMNIDVLSFSRLIHRIAEEVGRKERAVLDDTGKNLVLRKVAMEKENELVLLKEKVKRPGYIHEVKSMISEFYQYDIRQKDMDEMIAQAQGKGALAWKMQDLKVLYEGFAEYIREKFITTEESLDELCRMIPRSRFLEGSVIVFDGFTGFTPIQNRVLMQLLQTAEEVIVTLCADSRADLETEGGQQLFALSKKTYVTLSGLAEKHDIAVREPMYLTQKPVKRYENNEALAFLEANLFRYGNRVFDRPQQSLMLWEADNLVCELQRVCVEMKHLIREEGMCYRDIAVVTGDLSRYAHLLETEFQRYDIPYFIDQNRGVAHHPLTEYLKSALAIRKDYFSYESVMRFLRSGMSGLTTDEIDRLDHYIRAYGIRGKKAYSEDFVYSEQAEEINVIRRKLMEELSPVFAVCHTAKEYATALYELSHQSRLQEKCNAYAQRFDELGEASKAKEYEKIYPACMDLLNQIYELIGDDEMDVAEFLAIFEAGISEIQIGTIPQNVDQVVVGDIERTRLKKIRVLFFIGVNDGVIPGGGGNGGLLSDMERQFFMEQGRELAPTPRQKIFEQRLYLYQNMTKPSDRLYLSYSKMDGNGKSILPSYLLRVIRGMYPLIGVEKVSDKKAGNLAKIVTREDGLDDYAQLLRVFLNEEAAAGSTETQAQQALHVLCCAYRDDAKADKIRDAALMTYENIPLSDMAAELLYRDRNKGSVSRLELFASCAYAHFLRYGLELREQDEYDFDAMDFGIIYHHVLEVVSVELRQRKTAFEEADKELLQELVGTALDDYAKEYGGNILHSNARNEHRILQMKHVMMQSISAMQYQLSKGKFKPVYFERSFRLKGEFPLIGKVDRIDLCRDGDEVYVKVIDYKSGNKKFSLEELYHGLSLQLPAYMNAAVELLSEKEPDKKIIPASMLYCRLQNPYVDAASKEVEQEIYKEMRPEGLTSESDKVIDLLHEDLQGNSDVLRIGRNKDGSLSRSSQTLTEEAFSLVLEFTQHKIDELMGRIRQGEIGAYPTCVGKAQTDSCSYCDYKGICRLDLRIPGYRKCVFPKMDDEKIQEEMRHEIHTEAAGSHIDEK